MIMPRKDRFQRIRIGGKPVADVDFFALPLPVASIFSLLRWIVAQGSPASLQASTAAPSMGKRALTLLNCPENGSSMQTPMQSGPAKRWTPP